jgi:hypothetical protein
LCKPAHCSIIHVMPRRARIDALGAFIISPADYHVTLSEGTRMKIPIRGKAKGSARKDCVILLGKPPAVPV